MATIVKGHERDFDYNLVEVNDILPYGWAEEYQLDWHRTGPMVKVVEYKPSEGYFFFNDGIVADWQRVQLLLIQDSEVQEVRHAKPREKIWLDDNAGAIISYIGGYPGDRNRIEKACLVVARDAEIFGLAVVINSLENREVTV